MATKREALLAKAIKDETALFTSDDILTVAEISIKEVAELLDRVNSNTDEIINSFLKNKNFIDINFERGGYMTISNFDDLPIVLNAKLVKDILGISKASVYNLFHSEGFPSIYIGKRMLVSKESFKIWLEKQEDEIKV